LLLLLFSAKTLLLFIDWVAAAYFFRTIKEDNPAGGFHLLADKYFCDRFSFCLEFSALVATPSSF
jgi:hypothetical protein